VEPAHFPRRGGPSAHGTSIAAPYRPVSQAVLSTGHSPRARGLENSHGVCTASDGQDRDDPISATLLTRPGQLGRSASRDAHRRNCQSLRCVHDRRTPRLAQMTCRRANMRGRTWKETAETLPTSDAPKQGPIRHMADMRRCGAIETVGRATGCRRTTRRARYRLRLGSRLRETAARGRVTFVPPEPKCRCKARHVPNRLQVLRCAGLVLARGAATAAVRPSQVDTSKCNGEFEHEQKHACWWARRRRKRRITATRHNLQWKLCK
jgi:hypothetical protein